MTTKIGRKGVRRLGRRGPKPGEGGRPAAAEEKEIMMRNPAAEAWRNHCNKVATNFPTTYGHQPGEPSFEGGAAWEAYQNAKEIEAATIERCAQVAENYKADEPETIGNIGYKFKIAAAIRALKENSK